MVPKEAFSGDFQEFLREYFPGFGIEAEYNFTEKATTRAAGQQLNIGLQVSDLPWIKAALRGACGRSFPYPLSVVGTRGPCAGV
jgi:hypothetical protein